MVSKQMKAFFFKASFSFQSSMQEAGSDFWV